MAADPTCDLTPEQLQEGRNHLLAFRCLRELTVSAALAERVQNTLDRWLYDHADALLAMAAECGEARRERDELRNELVMARNNVEFVTEALADVRARPSAQYDQWRAAEDRVRDLEAEVARLRDEVALGRVGDGRREV